MIYISNNLEEGRYVFILQDIGLQNPSLVICKTSSKTLGTINIREMLIVASNWQCNL